MASLRRSQGFTLIELLVALAILAILSAQLFLAFQTQKETYVTNEHALDAQEDARLVMDLIATDARMAGYMIPERAAIASIDGGTTDPDLLCVSDSTVIDDSVLDGAADHFKRARVASVDSGTQITVSSTAQLNVDNDATTTNDFTVGQGIIISDGSVSHCARIVAIDTGAAEIDFDDESLTTAQVTALNANIGSVRAVPAVIYRVAGGLTRNGVNVSSEIEDLQVEFGVDIDGNNLLVGASEFPVHSLSAASRSPALVRAVRISVIARSPQPDPDYLGTDRGRPASANRVAGSSDTFLRRRFVSRVLPRNLN